MAAVTVCNDFGAQENKVCHCFHCFSPCLPWSDGTRCRDLKFFEYWVLSQLFHSSLSPVRSLTSITHSRTAGFSFLLNLLGSKRNSSDFSYMSFPFTAFDFTGNGSLSLSFLSLLWISLSPEYISKGYHLLFHIWTQLTTTSVFVISLVFGLQKHPLVTFQGSQGHWLLPCGWNANFIKRKKNPSFWKVE